MRRLVIIVLAALVFAAVLITRLPAAWVLPALRAELTCASASGSIWNGYCAGALVHGVRVDQLAWQVHPRALLHGRLSVQLTAVRGDASASGELSMGWSGPLRGHTVHARLPLSPALVPILPPYISGLLEADIARIEVARDGAIERLQGRLTVRHLIDSSGQVTPLGGFTVTFPSAPGEPVGRLRDLGGPLALTGTLRLTAQPGYVLRARVAARAGAAPSLVQALQYLGAADEEGLRPFALSGTY